MAGTTGHEKYHPFRKFDDRIGPNPRACQIVGDNLVGNCAADSILGPLQDNGGPTPTHALLLGSPAVDAGTNALAVDPFNGSALLTDQRGSGFPRIVDGNGDGSAIVDLGAFESQLVPTAANVSSRAGSRRRAAAASRASSSRWSTRPV